MIHAKTVENNATLDMTCAKTTENSANPDMTCANTAENCSKPDMISTRTLENGIRLKKWNLKTIKKMMYITDGQNHVANKNYITIGVSVRTTKFAARNNGIGVRQESNPQSPTVYSSVR
jgi:hypothetical protein